MILGFYSAFALTRNRELTIATTKQDRITFAAKSNACHLRKSHALSLFSVIIQAWSVKTLLHCLYGRKNERTEYLLVIESRCNPQCFGKMSPLEIRNVRTAFNTFHVRTCDKFSRMVSQLWSRQ